MVRSPDEEQPASDPMARTIQAWSPTLLQVYEECPFRAYLRSVKKIPEPERPELPAGQEYPNDRGTRIHDEAEAFVRGTGPMGKEMRTFKDNFEALRTLFERSPDSFEMEQLWCFDHDWNLVAKNAWDQHWARIKIDVFIHLSPTYALTIDYKGLPIETPLPTPLGWTTMGEVQIGNQLIDGEGYPCKITGKSRQKTLPCYRLVFDDTSEAICDEEHRWALLDGTVKEITDLRVGECIATAEAMDLPEQNLPIDPYVLGIWLADGKHTSGEITEPDSPIWEEIERRGYTLGEDYSRDNDKCRAQTVYGLRTQIREQNLLANKHIPEQYLRASFQQRLDLLRGLMDGDGTANHTRKQAILNTVDPEFADQVKELLLTLGQRPLLSPYRAFGFGKEVKAYFVSFRPRGINPFLLPRKADKVLPEWGEGRAGRRRIQSIEQIAPRRTQCVMVDSPDHTFLCTENFIPTHNSGKRDGNELKHGDQILNYAISAFLRFDDLEEIEVELWYLDQDELVAQTYTREQAMRFLPRLERRGMNATTDTEFPTRPSKWSCRFCPYKTGLIGKKGPEGTGHCDENPI